MMVIIVVGLLNQAVGEWIAQKNCMASSLAL